MLLIIRYFYCELLTRYCTSALALWFLRLGEHPFTQAARVSIVFTRN